ncbi:MAG: 5-formyltetrahydrofolate cyclo-ligase [Paludibacteraceae bacterium]|nr:5-formyltetrahydrofolate cyclo-ligase [Paludibacteraceae bacterium]
MRHFLTQWFQDRRYRRIGRQKDNLRQQVSRQRKSLSHEQVLELSEQVMQKLETLPEFERAQSVMVYYPLRNEVSTLGLIERWYDKKRILLPVINGSKLDIRPYEGQENMMVGSYGIMEPTTDLYTGPIDLIVIPGVAFDRSLNRLGRGKGYYDRFLHHTTRPIVGICYDFQLVEEVPSLSHDHRVTRIVTPTEIVG